MEAGVREIMADQVMKGIVGHSKDFGFHPEMRSQRMDKFTRTTLTMEETLKGTEGWD